MRSRMSLVLPCLTLAFIVAASVCWVLTSRKTAIASREFIVLLVHGMTWREEDPAAVVWGSQVGDAPATWDGMIGYLEHQGFRFGGVIRAEGNRVSLPSCLDQRGTSSKPDVANLFCLEFSRSAKGDGLAYRAEELACCLRELRRLTGCRKVRLVGHSAGGLVARVYLQSATHGVEYAGDVDRLITISTPHLGSAAASKLRWFIPVQAAALRPEADLIQRLNTAPLPEDVLFASIVTRVLGAGGRDTGIAYDSFADREYARGLPVDFRLGGDQVVHVRSQNLRMARCAAGYEERTNRPVQPILVQIPAPESDLFERNAHAMAPRNAEIMSWVSRLLKDDGRFWTGLQDSERAEWIEHQARQSAFSMIEQEAAERHKFSRVFDVVVNLCEQIDREGRRRIYNVRGRAKCRDLVSSTASSLLKRSLSVNEATWWPVSADDVTNVGHYQDTGVTGRMELTLDGFDRIVLCRSVLEHVQDRPSTTP